MAPSGGKYSAVQAQLGLWDAVSIIIGIVIGAGIYKVPPLVFGNVSGPLVGLGAWGLGGLLALVGALCYAELATTYPRVGGDYVYLSRAFGPWLGFLFGWAQLAVVLTASTGAMAYVFADYGVRLWHLGPGWTFLLAAAAVTVLSGLNTLGVVFGKGAQNVLTAAKVLGLGGILASGFLWADSAPSWEGNKPVAGPGFGLAMIFVLYAYGGWNDAAFVAAEVRNRRRNIPLALLLGTVGITLIYLLINAAYLLALGFEGARQSREVAADVLHRPLGTGGERAMCLLVMVSALGAVNGLIFTGARVYSKLGAENRALAWLGRWNPRRGVPVCSLLVQALVSLGMIAAVGTDAGREGINRLLAQANLDAIPWEKYGGGFDTLVSSTAPVFWTFFLLTGLSLFVLRERDAGIERPFSVPLFPVLPLIFCGMCFYMLYSAIEFAGKLALIPAAATLAGLPLFFLSEKRADQELPVEPEPASEYA